jgi:hypothetical protein
MQFWCFRQQAQSVTVLFDVLVNLQNCKNRSEWLGILNTFRTKYYYRIVQLSQEIETINIEFRTA